MGQNHELHCTWGHYSIRIIFFSSRRVPLPYLQVLGKPSAELAAKMSSEEKERVCKQQECLGEEGLRERGQELDKAIAQNEVRIPILNLNSTI